MSATVPQSNAATTAEAPSGFSWAISAGITCLLLLAIEFQTNHSLMDRIGPLASLVVTIGAVVLVQAVRHYLLDTEQHLGILLLSGLAVLVTGYGYLDDRWFAARRPWSLTLMALAVGGSVASLACFVFVVLRMFRSEKDATLGKFCATLSPTGLGPVLAFAWGWKEAARDQKDKLVSVMLGWTTATALLAGVLGYAWLHAPANASWFGLVSRLREAPLDIDASAVQRDAFRIRLISHSDQPLRRVSCAAFPGEEYRRGPQRRPARRQVLETIGPRASVELPWILARGWIVECDCGDAGVKVFEVE